MRRNRGYTLFELAIYLFLFAVAAGAVLALFQAGRNTGEATQASYLVSGSTDNAIRWLRQDLQETALASIRVHPGAGDAGEPPGVSMVSPRAYSEDKQGEFLVNRHGAPQWDKHVYYTIQMEPGAQTGTLVRWERELEDKTGLPSMSVLRPSQGSTDHRRVMLHSVVAPGATMQGVGSTGSLTADEFGGFRVQFIRRLGGEAGAEQFTTVNPTKGNPEDNTKLVEVELKIFQMRGSKPNYFALKFRVAPRY